MSATNLRTIHRYSAKTLGLQRYYADCGDGRLRPRKPAPDLLWALLAAQLIRETSFHATEVMVHSAPRFNLGIGCQFCDDTLAYFTERMDPQPTRSALADVLHHAKRNKAFQEDAFIGLAIDGTTVGRCEQSSCSLCRPYRNQKKEIVGYHHHLAMISVVGTHLSLPFDVEPYGPKDSEYAAGQRLLRRAMQGLGPRFADYLVVDAAYATSTFLHTARELAIAVVARLKDNLPELSGEVERYFHGKRPHRVTKRNGHRVELWDSSDFGPWETLDWKWVRVLRYREIAADGTVIAQAQWFTNLPASKVGTLTLFKMARSRWEIENQGFNDCKSRQGFEHICHHEPHSLVICWLLTLLALVIGRLFRIRYLHRGNHPIRSAIELVRLLRLSLGQPRFLDST
ncbi:MAG: transposase [Bryobacterales bacterium]|nr:transposase [Bryobacterales bacterium]